MYSTITGKRKSFDIPRPLLYKGSLYRGSTVTVFYRASTLTKKVYGNFSSGIVTKFILSADRCM